MLRMVEKYSTDLPAHVPEAGRPLPLHDTVLLTGTTGALGTMLLASLVSSPQVRRVYALNRKASKNLLDRQVAALQERGVDQCIATSSKVVLVEIDLGEERMGLSSETFEEVNANPEGLPFF